MVSFSCNKCQDTLKKPKLVQHFQRCHAPFTCLDCNKEMYDGEFQKHTTCISEAEKYEKTLYKGDKKKGKGQQQQQQKQNGQAQQQQKKAAETVAAAPPVVATPSVPSTSTAATNGSDTKPVATPNQGTDVKVAPSASAEPTSDKKEKKRKRKSEVAKPSEADAGNTSDAQIAKALVADTPAEKPLAAAEPTPVSKAETPEVKSEEKKSRKRHRKDKSKAAAASTNGDVSMQVDNKPTATSEAAVSPVAAASTPKVDLKETLTSNIPEKGKSISLAEALAGLPADQIQEALAGLRVQKGKKDKFELSVGYA